MKIEKVELDAEQSRKWTDTRVALSWHCPAFTHIFYSMLNTMQTKDYAFFTKDVPIAATDGAALFLNPDTFFKYNLNERVFICGHEILHCIFNHCGLSYSWRKRGKVTFNDGTSLPYDDEVMNKAMDYVINDILVESKSGQYNKDWLHAPTIATAKDSVVDAYKKVYKNNPPPNGQKGFDVHLAPGTGQGKDPSKAAAERNEAQWSNAVAEAAAVAKAQGKLPAGLDRLFNEILNPVVDWREHIKSLFSKRVGTGSYDWLKPDRRLITRDIYAPGRSGFGAGLIVIGVDTSGSIGPKELDMFMAEMAGILEDVKPKRILIVWCDAAIGRVDEAEEVGDLNTIRAKGAPGGGGTAFEPVFKYIADEGLEPEALVYLTDGMGSFPKAAPSYPVIWGSIYEPSKYPFGDVVQVPKQAA